MPTRLVESLELLSASLDDAELTDLKLILGMAVGTLAADSNIPTDPTKRSAFDAAAGGLCKIQSHSDRITEEGFVWRGYPSIITPEIFSRLTAEAKEHRESAVVHANHYLGFGGPVANEFATNKDLVDFIVRKAGPVTPTAVASYLYYEDPGQGINPHVDTEIFSINFLVMLDHHAADAKASDLILFPPGREPSRIKLEPGEAILFFADSVVHARSSVGQDEFVSILTIGFQPA